ncbi:MAG: lamin tail domain-containing protein [Puniceicoccales bacterium]
MTKKTLPLISIALAATSTFGQIAITEYQNNPNDSNQYSEFIEIYNYSDSSVDLSGWTISDTAGLIHTYDNVLASGEYFIVARVASSFNPATNTFAKQWPTIGESPSVVSANGSMILADGGENITLTDGSGYNWSVANFAVTTPGVSLVLDSSFDFSTITASGVSFANDSSYVSAVAGVDNAWTSTQGQTGSPLAGAYSPIPEPGTYALLAGCAALASLMLRRRC